MWRTFSWRRQGRVRSTFVFERVGCCVRSGIARLHVMRTDRDRAFGVSGQAHVTIATMAKDVWQGRAASSVSTVIVLTVIVVALNPRYGRSVM